MIAGSAQKAARCDRICAHLVIKVRRGGHGLAFGWLTNAVRPDDVVSRLLLTLAMIGFFVIALDLPYAFQPQGWAFAVAYLLVVVIHTGLYLTSAEPTNRRAILRIAPTNAALADAPPQRRQDRAFNAYAIGHVIMTMGIVVVAAGIADAIHHLGGHAQPWLLGGGAATFLAGHAVHRGVLASGRIVDRVIGAVAAVPARLLAVIAGWAGLAAVTVVLAVVGTLDHLAMRAHQ